LRQRLDGIAQRHGAVSFVIRLDAAGQYADNLLHFLHGLTNSGTDATRLANSTVTVSCGDPQRNQNYRAALFGNKKSDPLEARACARYALCERPAAAVLTAFILDIDRFDTVNQLVAYFGTLPIEVASGVDRDGQPRGPKRSVMSRRGNDLVRRYLWMAALSAVRHNPAVRALYARVVAKHPQHKAIAVGHAMRKLLHLAFAIWKSKKPFDPEHYPWATPAHVEGQGARDEKREGGDHSDIPMLLNEPATGLNPDVPEMSEVTAADSLTSTPAETSLLSPAGRGTGSERRVDFAHLKKQMPLARVLDHLGLGARLRGRGPQRRGPCPIHRGNDRGTTFSVNLQDNVFCCHHKDCGKKGDVIDLWASVNGMSLRDAALDLVQTFHLEPAPDQRRDHG
jgi:hypothetical protein